MGEVGEGYESVSEGQRPSPVTHNLRSHSSDACYACQCKTIELSCLVISNGIGSLRVSTSTKVWWTVLAFVKFFHSSGVDLRPHFYAPQVLNSTRKRPWTVIAITIAMRPFPSLSLTDICLISCI